MHIVVQGQVIIYRKIQGQPFPIERLCRGSIINSILFINRDKIEYYAVCRTTVVLRSLLNEKMLKLRKKHEQLEELADDYRVDLDDDQTALDYVLVEENVPVWEKPERERINKLRVQLKNAVMRHLVLVKDQTPSVPSLQKILSNEIDFLKRGSVLQPQLEKRATVKEHRTNEPFAQRPSYLSKEQFQEMDDRLCDLKEIMMKHAEKIDTMEHQLIKLSKRTS